MVKDSKVDKILISITALLTFFGLIMIYSSTMILAKEKYGDSFFFLKKHLVWLAVGFILFAFIALLRSPIYLDHRLVFVVVFIAIATLILVFFAGKINNSYRWIKVLGFSVQPSEFSKIAIVLYLAYILGKKLDDVNNIGKLLLYLIPFFIIEILILKEPDVGSFLLIFIILIFMLFAAGLKIRFFFSIALFMGPILYLIVKMNPEKMKRILAFLNPEEHFATYGFQTIQSIYAIGSGGLFGQGLGNSTQKLYFLPYAYSDFIFSIIGEELGLIGALTVVVLFFVFLLRGLNIAKLSGSKQTYLLVMGLTFLVVLQAMIHFSVALGLFPTKGIPLPFISNGGSSLLSSLIIAGIIVNVSRHRRMVFVND
jgi:cell division protein FtsW